MKSYVFKLIDSSEVDIISVFWPLIKPDDVLMDAWGTQINGHLSFARTSTLLYINTKILILLSFQINVCLTDKTSKASM